MVATRRQREQEEEEADEQRSRHNEYMREYRRNDDYVTEELKQRVLNRIKKGAIPNVKSMAKYNITLEEVNRYRVTQSMTPITMNVPMFLKSDLYTDRAGGITEADAIPAMSEAVGEVNFDSDDEIQQPMMDNETLEEYQLRLESTFNGKYDADSIAKWMRTNPRKASSKRFGSISEKTTEKYFGKPLSTGDTGDFKRFLKYLGEKYYDDFREVLHEDAEAHIRTKINTPRENIRINVDRVTGEPNRFKNLASTRDEFSTFLIVMRTYPPFFEEFDNKTPAFTRRYTALDRLYMETDAKVQAEKAQNPKKGFEIPPWKEVMAKWEKKYPKSRFPKENLYIKMYNEVPSRDDFAELFVDDTDFDIPYSKQQIESVQRNTLYIPNNTTRKSMKKAYFVLKNYKTKSLYGTRAFEFSVGVTKQIIAYIKTNKVTAQGSDRYLFGKQKMSSFVGSSLNAISGIPDKREGNINFLRKSYISSALQNAKDAKERQDLAYLLRHSPNASLQYVRELKKDKGVAVESLDANTLQNVRDGVFDDNQI